MKEYINHLIANVFPMMTDAEIQELAQDIKINGLKESILIFEDKILDGRNRYAACKISGVEPRIEIYEGNTPMSEVISRNLIRRHLDAGQKACVATDILPFIEAEAKTRNIRINVDTGDERLEPSLKKEKRLPQSRDIAAKAMNTSGKSVQLAKKLKIEMPEVFEKVKSGAMKLKQAKNELYKKNEALKKSTKDIEITSEDIQLHNCDIADSKIEDNSIDVIITDPPYPRGYLSCWTKLARFAVDKLKIGGILIAISGQSYLPDVYKNMTIEGLDYYWTCCIYTPGVSAELQNKKLRTNWKPLLFYVKGDYKKTFQSTDVYITKYEDTAASQQYHKWGQSFPLFDNLVKDYSYTTDLICDPYLGSGTCALAALSNKRKFVGIEINKETYNIAKNRIAEEI